jgi:hypothetical protein
MRCHEKGGWVRPLNGCFAHVLTLRFERLFVSTCIPTLTALYYRLLYPGHGHGPRENGSLHLLLQINDMASNLGHHAGTVYAR